MVKLLGKPMRSASRRKMRTQVEWKVAALTSPPTVSPSMGFQALFQLAGGLVGKGDGQHVPGAGGAHGQAALGAGGQVAACRHGLAQRLDVRVIDAAFRQLFAAVGGAKPDDVGHAADQHGGLAAARASQNQQRAFGTKDRLLLDRVQSGKMRGDVLVAQGAKFGCVGWHGVLLRPPWWLPGRQPGAVSGKRRQTAAGKSAFW